MNNDDRNLHIFSSTDGKISTDDSTLNKILDSVQSDGKILGAFIPAITFVDNPDQKAYLVLSKMYDWKNIYDEIDTWFIKIGRQKVYEFLRNLIIHEEIDPNRSFIISGELVNKNNKESVEFNSSPITVFRFMKVMAETGKVMETTDFDIDEYSISNTDIYDEFQKEDPSIIDFIDN